MTISAGEKKMIKGYLLIECYYLHLTDMSLEKGEEERQMFQTFGTTSLQKSTFREGRVAVCHYTAHRAVVRSVSSC